MPDTGGVVATRGALALQVIRGGKNAELVLPPHPWPLVTDDRMRLDLSAVREFAAPQRGLDAGLNEWRTRNVPNMWRGLRRAAAARMLGVPSIFGALWIAKWDGARKELVPMGLASLRVITDAGVAAMADTFTNTVEAEVFNFHGMGTGGTAEAASQTALVTELTTEYNPNSTRATGTQTSPTNVYQTVGTNTIDSGTPAITEHGIFSQAATGGGTMLDRSLFSAINLVGANADGIQFTYQLTFTSGG
jgi:hypothetical protein